MAIQNWTMPDSAVQLLGAELNSLANDAAVTSATFNNAAAANLKQYATFELAATFASAPTADRTVDLYAVYSGDGSLFEDSSAARPPAMGLLGSFVLDNTASAQRKLVTGVMLLPFAVRFMVVNKAGFAMTASGHSLRLWTFNQQVS
jgi:hypothetical protein